jgi:hypothetical protein
VRLEPVEVGAEGLETGLDRRVFEGRGRVVGETGLTDVAEETGRRIERGMGEDVFEEVTGGADEGFAEGFVV